MCKAKLSTLWMLSLDVVIDGKGFVEQHPAGLQRVNERGEEGAVQVKADDNGIVHFMPEIRVLRWRRLQIQHSRTDAGKVSYSGTGRKSCEGLFIAIDRIDLVAERGEEQCVTSAARGYIEDSAFGKPLKLLDEKPGRWWICSEDVLCEPCTFNTDSDRTGHVGDRRMQLSEPQLDMIDREFSKEGCQESFRQRFQQL